MTKVLITGKLHPETIKAFESHDRFDLTYQPDCPKDQLYELVSDAEMLITRSETTVDAELMSHAHKLKVVIRAAVGVGNIDLEAATKKGILVINTPGKNTNSAAEMTLGLLLAMFRKIPKAHEKVKSGGWDRHRFTGRELRGKTIGLVGLGNVGHRVAKFCRGFDMEVWAYDPYISPDRFKAAGAKLCESLDQLCQLSDVLSVHVPLNKETKGMIGKEQLQLLKKGSYVLNAARGGVIHEGDLLEALQSSHIAGAGIDTFENEPHPLKELIDEPEVYVTPHIGASTIEAQQAIGQTVYEQAIKFLEGSVVDYPVNLPEIGILDHPILKPYAVLSEKLGSLVGQLVKFNPKKITLHYRGDIAGLDNSILKLSFMKGYVKEHVDEYVSFVNAKELVAKMGIEVSEAKDPEFSGYKSAIKVVVESNSDLCTVGGVVFDERYLRITLINDYYFEIDPSGSLLIFQNEDKPGVIGHIGTELAAQNINISSFNLSRNSKGGKAMAIVSVDEAIGKEGLLKLRAMNHILTADQVDL